MPTYGVEADFIAGPLDGQTMALPEYMPTFRCRIDRPAKGIAWQPAQEFMGQIRRPDLAIYQYIGHGAYMLTETQKGD